jgi:hypothetical protein
MESQPCYPFDWCTSKAAKEKMDPYPEIVAEFALREKRRLLPSVRKIFTEI